jgi:hypothetical protein
MLNTPMCAFSAFFFDEVGLAYLIDFIKNEPKYLHAS